MPAFEITDVADVVARRNALRQRLYYQHEKMRDLDGLRHLVLDEVEADIWEDVGENFPRTTILDNSVSSITNTVRGFLTGARPTVSVTPKNPVDADQAATANRLERLGYGILDTINLDRDSAIEDDLTEMAVHRGVVVIQTLWLSPEERGADVIEVQPQIAPDLLNAALGGTEEEPLRHTEGGDFPVLTKILDPFDCFWELDDRGQVVEFVHEYKIGLAQLVRRFPQIKEQSWWGTGQYHLTPDAAEDPVTVSDYWDDELNAIVIDDTEWIKKPTTHGYEFFPVIVELIDPVTIRRGTSGGDGLPRREGTPFCHPIRELVVRQSQLASLTMTYLKTGVFNSYVLENTDPSTSFHWSRNDRVGADGVPGSGQPTFEFVADFSPMGQVIPTAPGEKLLPLMPAPIAPMLEKMTAYLTNSVAKGSFNEGILTGMWPAEPPSGYSVVQQQVATTARIKPCRKGGGRAMGRMIHNIIRLFATEWDAGPTAQVTLSVLTGQSQTQYEQVGYTQEDFKVVGSVFCDLNPDVHLDKEQQDASIIQKYTTGLLHPITAIDKLGDVQDPEAEFANIMAYQFMKMDPHALASFAWSVLNKQGIKPLTPLPPPGAGQPPPGAGGPPAAQPPPSLPSSGGPAPAPAGPPPGGAPEPNGGGPQLDPQMLMQLLAQSRGGQ